MTQKILKDAKKFAMRTLVVGLAALLVLAVFVPVTRAAGTDVYVSAAGDDATGDGSKTAPYATLARAAQAVNEAAGGEAFTVRVMSDLVSEKCARFYDKNVTITSDGGAFTVTRGENFETQQDVARGTYNPAMIEIQSGGENAAPSLTIKNLTLDDAGRHAGTVFAQAVSVAAPPSPTENTVYVQDAIVASNATVPCTITLGEGARLVNFGGMSAVRVTNKATVVMASGSVIEDNNGMTRKKGDAANEVGPAGAIWCQGGAVEMKNGAAIRNLDGRAIYADGGSVVIDGAISGIKPNAKIWQGDVGSAIHLRGDAVGTLTQNARIFDISGGGNAVYVGGSKFDMQSGAKIENLTKVAGVYVNGCKDVTLNSEITGISNAVAVSLNDGATATLGKDGRIHDNRCATAVVYMRGGSNLTVYGKINDNTSEGNCAALYIVTNGDPSHATMEDGGEICGNTNGGTKYGAAVEVQQGDCSFTMNGGRISGNAGPLGAIQVHKGSAVLIMNGGEVAENALNGSADADANVSLSDGTPRAELNAGKLESITVNKGIAATSAAGRVFIKDGFDLQSEGVRLVQDGKLVKPAADSRDVKLGNAGNAAVTKLNQIAAGKGWSAPYATFYAQREGLCSLTVVCPPGDAALPVYVIAIPMDANGAPVGDAMIYTARHDESEASFELPLTGENGYAVALVQPTLDDGSVTIEGPAELFEQEGATSYDVPYTATYTMSQNLASQIALLKDQLNNENVRMTFVVQLDSRLTAKTGAGDYVFTSPIFEVDTVTGSGSTLTATVRLKDDWKEHIGELVANPMTLRGTGVLDAAKFAAGEYLNTTGKIEGGVGPVAFYIPANNCKTLMVPLTEYTLTYDANGGTGAPAATTQKTTTGEAVFSISAIEPQYDDHIFLGWSTTPDGAAEYGKGLLSSITITEDTTLYAVWGVPETLVTLTYDANGGTGAPAAAQASLIDGKASFVITDAVPSKTGYAFRGWSLTKDGKAAYTAGQTAEFDADTTLYAVWEAVDAPVKTGDGGNPALWICMAATALAAFGAAALIRRKKTV